MKDRDTPTGKLKDLIRQVLKEDLEFEVSLEDNPPDWCGAGSVSCRLSVYLGNDLIHETTSTYYK